MTAHPTELAGPEPGGGFSAGRGWTLFVAFGALYAATRATSQVLMGDPAYYMGLARSLVEGHGYVFNGAPHTIYPPGFPAWLAPVVAAFGSDPDVGQLWVAVLGAAALVAVALYLFRRGDVSHPVFLTALVGGSSAYYALATGSVRSEMPYVLCSFLVLAAIERAETSSADRSVRWAGAAALTVLTVLVRTIGVTLALALLATAAHRWVRGGRRERRRAMLAGVAGIAGLAAFAAWIAWGRANPGGGSYFAALTLANPHNPDAGTATVAMFGLRVLESFQDQATHAAELVTGIPWLLRLWASPLLVGTVAVVLTGAVAELGRSNPLAGWYLLGYAGLLVLWPYDEGGRFLVPVLPLLLELGWQGSRRILDEGARRPRIAGAAVLAAAILGLIGIHLERGQVDPTSRQLLVSTVVWAGLLVLGAAIAWRPRHYDRVERSRGWITGAWVAMYVVVNVVGVVGIGIRNTRGTREDAGPSVAPALDWIARNTPADAVIMAQTEGAIVFHTGRPVVPLPRTGDPEVLRDRLLTEKPDFLFINDPHDFAYYRPTPPERYDILRKSLPPGCLRLVYEYGDGRIYAVSAGAGSGADRREASHPPR